MNLFSKLVFLGLMVAFLPFESCSQNTATVEKRSYRAMLNTLLSHTVPEIGATAAAKEEDAIFLDAREWQEYEVSHIEDALFVGYDNFEMESVAEVPKDRPVIVYCSVGYRSEKISERLIRAGYNDVKNLYGGIFEWKNAGLPVVDESNEATERVHAYNRTWGIWLRKGKKVY